MTPAELEKAAELIRKIWRLAEPEPAQPKQPGEPGYTFERTQREHWDRLTGKTQPAPRSDPQRAAANYLSQIKATRQPGPQDVGMLAALECDLHAPMIYQSRQRRREYLRWLANKRSDDACRHVMSGPPKPGESELSEF